jgi:hypothetical protein
MASDYRPPAYNTTGMARPIVPIQSELTVLDRQALAEALRNSERSSITVDLTTDEKIDAFIDTAQHFDPRLIALMNNWAHTDDKERARDSLTIDGQTASARMWEQGKSFMDVICDTQRHLDDPSHMPDMTLSAAGPDMAGQRLTPLAVSQQQPPQMGIFGRFANWVSRGAYGRRLIEQEDIARREVLAAAPENTEELAAHNKAVLQAEQILKDDTERLSEMNRADATLRDHEQWLTEQVEKDNRQRDISDAEIRPLSDQIGILDAEETDIAAFRQSVARGDSFSRHLESDNLQIFDLDGMRNQKPPRLDMGRSMDLDRRISSAALSYSRMTLFNRFADMTPEEFEAARPSPGADPVTDRIYGEVEGLPPEQREQRREALKAQFNQDGRSCLTAFQGCLDSTGLAALSTEEATRARAARRTETIERRDALTEARDHAAIPGIDTHGQQVDVDMSPAAMAARMIELEDVRAMRGDMSRDIHSTEAGVRASQAQLTNIRAAIPGTPGYADPQLTNAPPINVQGSVTPAIAEAARTGLHTPAAQTDKAGLYAARANLDALVSARDADEQILGDLQRTASLDADLFDAASRDRPTRYREGTQQNIATYIQAAREMPSARYDLLTQDNQTRFEQDIHELTTLSQREDLTGFDSIQFSTLVSHVRNTVNAAIEANPNFVAMNGRDFGEIRAEHEQSIRTARDAYEPLESATRAERQSTLIGRVAERSAASERGATMMRELTSSRALSREEGVREIRGRTAAQPSRERETELSRGSK